MWMSIGGAASPPATERRLARLLTLRSEDLAGDHSGDLEEDLAGDLEEDLAGDLVRLPTRDIFVGLFFLKQTKSFLFSKTVCSALRTLS
jgi:hypothetical protein